MEKGQSSVNFPADCKSLMIIDMQKGFLLDKSLENPHLQRTIHTIIELAKRCKEHCKSIVVVEYSDRGATIDEILREVQNYERAVFLKKATDSVVAMPDNEQWLSQNAKNVLPMFVTGINVSGCVRDSIWDIHEKFPKATLYISPHATMDINMATNSADTVKTIKKHSRGRVCIT